VKKKCVCFLGFANDCKPFRQFDRQLAPSIEILSFDAMVVKPSQPRNGFDRGSLGPGYAQPRECPVSQNLGAAVSGSWVVCHGASIEIFKAKASFIRAAPLQEQRGTFGEACCDEPPPTAALP
jgi:hypothetical protein